MALSNVVDLQQDGVVEHKVKAWIVCLTAGLFFLYEFIQMNMFNAINEALRTSFQLNATQLGLLSSTYLLADIMFLIPAGLMLDRFSTKKIILSAMLVCIIGTFGFALTTSLYQAAFFHFLSGCGNAFSLLSCIILVSRWFKPNRRALVIGLIGTLAFTGGLIAQTPLAWMASYVGWRHSLMYDGVLGLGIWTVIYFVVSDYPSSYKAIQQQHTHNLKKSSFFSSLGLAMKNRQNWLAGLYTCLLNLPIMVLDAVWGVTYLHEVHGLSEIDGSNVTAMIFIGSIIGSPLAGWWSDSWGYRRKPMLIAAVLSLLFMCLALFVHGWHYHMLLLLFFLVGFFTSAQVISYPMITESNSLMITGTAVSLASTLIMGGAGVAQVLFGKLLDINWDGVIANGQRVYSAANYNSAMLMFPIAIFIGLIAIWFARETRCLSVRATSEVLNAGHE